MEDYFKAVTLGAFTWKNEERIALLLEYIRKQKAVWLLFHFLLLTMCLNFPVIFQISRLEPFELYSRLYSVSKDNITENKEQLTESIERIEEGRDILSLVERTAAGIIPEEEFNSFMIQNQYGRNVLLPLLAFSFGLTLIIQIVFYLTAVWFLSVSRMNFTPLSFLDRAGLSVFSSTFPVLAACLLGFFLPTVHFIIYYFIVIFFIFQRSKLCPNG